MVSRQGTVLIPAAGQSVRFGSHGPKGLLSIALPYRTDPMIAHVCRQVPMGWDILLVVPEGTAGAFRRALLGVLRTVRILEIRTPNGGQADSIRSGLRALMTVPGTLSDPLIVHNCDTVIEAAALRSLSELQASACVLHRDLTDGCAFSYVDDPVRPRVWAEKQRISDYAQTGAWRFQSAMKLVRALDDTGTGEGESYLSHYLHHVPDMMGMIVGEDEWIDLGTPEAVHASGGMIVR